MRKDKQKESRLKPENKVEAESRKKDHIELAFQSQIAQMKLDRRFFYEPILSAHPTKGGLEPFRFLDKKMKAPIWVSSMTGGTELARTINHNLAKACKEFGLGMGLGSCRALLYSNDTLEDFDVRKFIGDAPLFANLGIAQLEQLIVQDELYRVNELIQKIDADGLIIHVNPMQEWLQPEGDVFLKAPIDTIKKVLEYASFPIIVKEVGQGMGYESLKALFQLPLAAIDFAANGGTNFSKLEMLRSDELSREAYGNLALIGHHASEMVDFSNDIMEKLPNEAIKCKQVIISGGIKNFLDGYYLINKLAVSSVYGQASSFLKHAQGSYGELQRYVETQIRGLELANAYLSLR